MGANEVETLQALTQRRTILDGLIASHRGRIANTAGDSVLAEFGSAVDAVQCAVEAQAALARANADLWDCHINFRIGVHVGDVMIKAVTCLAMASISPHGCKLSPVVAAPVSLA
jgi:class 3 adenylate cyclase